MLESGVRYMQIELKDRVRRMTVFQTYVFDYYFWVNLDERCPHTVTVYPNFSIFTGVNCRSKFDMRYMYTKFSIHIRLSNWLRF